MYFRVPNVYFPQWIFSGEKLRLHERERRCAYETVNEGRKEVGRQGYWKRKGDIPRQHAVGKASMPPLGGQGQS